MPTLAELLASASDDLEITIGTEKIKASDLKGFQRTAETARQQAERDRAEAIRITGEAKNLVDGLTAAQEELRKKNAPPKNTSEDDWEKNPLYEDIAPILKAARQAAKESMDLARATKQELDTTKAFYQLERMKREWADEADKPAGKTFEEVATEALMAKELDAQGMPTIKKTLARYNEPTRMEKFAADKVAAAEKEWVKKHRAAEISKPGKFTTKKSADAPLKNLDALNSELIQNDPEIVAMMNEGAN